MVHYYCQRMNIERKLEWIVEMDYTDQARAVHALDCILCYQKLSAINHCRALPLYTLQEHIVAFAMPCTESKQRGEHTCTNALFPEKSQPPSRIFITTRSPPTFLSLSLPRRLIHSQSESDGANGSSQPGTARHLAVDAESGAFGLSRASR